MGSAVNDLSFTSPRRPCAPPIWATQMRSATAGYPARRASACRRGAGGSRGFGCRGLGGLLGLRLALLARDRARGIAARLALHHARLVEKAQHAVGRQRPFREPRLHLVEIELETLALIFGQQRVEKSEPLDEAAVARRTAVRNHDVVDRPFLGPGAGETNLQRHLLPFWSITLLVNGRIAMVTSSFSPIREIRRAPAAKARPAVAAAARVYWEGVQEGRRRPKAVRATRPAFSAPAFASLRRWAWRRRGRACWRAPPSVRACPIPSPSSCRPCRGAS